MNARLLLLLLGGAMLTLAGAATPLRAETLTLDACLREVLERNPEISRARIDLERAQGQRLVFRARALPRLRADAVLGYQGSRGPGRDATALAAASLNLSQPLFDAAVPASLRRAELEVELARQNFLQVATGRLYLARLYFHLIQRRRATQEIELRTARRLEANAGIQVDLEKAGLGPRRSTLQAQIQRLSLEPQRAYNTGEIARNVAALRELLGRAGNAADPDPEPLGDGLPPAFDAAALAREALTARPDLLFTRSAIRASAQDQRIVEANWFPLLDLRLGGTAVPQSNSASTNPNAVRATDASAVTEFRYGIAFNWTVIDGGSTLGQSRSLAAGRASLAAALLRAEQQIPLDLGRLQARITSIRQRAAAATEARTSAAQSVATVLDLLRAGKISQLDVINAEAALLAAEQAAIDARGDAAEAAAELDRITGRYLRFARLGAGG